MAISVILDKNEYSAGETIEATVELNLSRVVKARAIFAKLTCNEKKKTKHTRHIPRDEIEEKRRLGLYTEVPFTQVEIIESRTIFKDEKKIADNGNYLKEKFTIMFKLPSDAASTSREFGHDNKITIWNLHVKIDIPFAIDITVDKEVFVAEL